MRQRKSLVNLSDSTVLRCQVQWEEELDAVCMESGAGLPSKESSIHTVFFPFIYMGLILQMRKPRLRQGN